MTKPTQVMKNAVSGEYLELNMQILDPNLETTCTPRLAGVTTESVLESQWIGPSERRRARWQRVSGKGKDYAVMATIYWSVDWTVGGRRGTEHVIDSTTRQVHVGELQVVIEK